MVMRIEEQDVLSQEAGALILTFDGENLASDRGADFVTGNVANQFRARSPDAWERVEAAIQGEHGPVACGRVLTVELPSDVGPEGLHGVILASTLRHQGDVSARAMSAIVVAAVRGAVKSARSMGWESLACPVLKGGWRLDTRSGFLAMVQGYREAARSARSNVPDLVVCETHPEGFSIVTKAWDQLLRQGPR